MTQTFRTILIVFTALTSLGVSAAAFWYQDWQYSLPTPVPPGLSQNAPGSVVNLPEALQNVGTASDNRPLFLHFFNPTCPCSRFNLGHVRMLNKKYGAQVRFVAVLQGLDERQVKKDFAASGLDMEAVTDTTGALAAAYGVYSTPQAVLLDEHSRLRYRGNYNVARYCRDADTEFARIAVESVLKGEALPSFPPAATKAYGCPLPSGKRFTPTLRLQ